MRPLEIIHPDLLSVVVAQNTTSIVFTVPAVTTKSGGTAQHDLAAQTVRVSYDTRAFALAGEAGTAPLLRAIVYADDAVDIAEGYRFTHAGNRLRVTDVIPTGGGIQAYCEEVIG
jgi:hypothetical protein